MVRSRTGTLATVGCLEDNHTWWPCGTAIDGEIWLETKLKSQKVVNPNGTPGEPIEDGMTYDSLRGVSFEGVAEIHDDPTRVRRGCQCLGSARLHTEDPQTVGGVDDEQAAAVRIVSGRVRSWDHHKLGLLAMPVAGSTAPNSRP